MKLTTPELSFVVVIGVSGSGKSTFARRHIKPTMFDFGRWPGAARFALHPKLSLDGLSALAG